ncbi:MAG: hypothetical protein DMD80_16055 [Candidatus Rokuibacteriota bacterium]|nr:MAG: hypothetical protein DMD80_16055 [Candidatus Rokubacteria bacterium]
MPPTRHLVACVLLAEIFNVPCGAGCLVKTVAKNSPAWNAGVLGGDRPATIQGQEIVVRGDLMLEVTGIGIRGVQDMAQIRDTLGTMKTGSPLAISVLRAGKVIELTGTLP